MRSLLRVRVTRMPVTPTVGASLPTVRNLHGTVSLSRPYKDDQDRESLKPKPSEGTKSGTDDAAAESDAAFDRHDTNPESERERGGKPLDASGANQKLSKPQGDEGKKEAEAGKGGDKKTASKGGSPQKHGKAPTHDS